MTTWAEVPAGDVNDALSGFLVGLGTSAGDVLERMKGNPKFVSRLVSFARDGGSPKVGMKVASTYAYPPEYSGPKPLLEQIKMWKEIFPDLDVEPTVAYIEGVVPTLKVTADAEGWFVRPRWKSIADTRHAALEIILEKIAASRAFHNYRKGELGADRLSMHPDTEMAWALFQREQQGHFDVFPAQYGMRHRGESVLYSRNAIAERPDEFRMDSFSGSCMALVHPERYVRSNGLDTDFPGDKYDYPGGDDRFAYAPFLLFNDELKFGAHHIGVARGSFGSVSGFLPQSYLESLGS